MRRPRIVLEADEFQRQVRGMRYDLSPHTCLEKKEEMVMLRKGADRKGTDDNQVGEICPPPLEAYIVLRPHRVPKIADLDQKKVSDSVGTGKGMGTREKVKEKGIGVGKGEVGVGWDDGVPGDIPTFEKWYVPNTFRSIRENINS